MEFEVEIGGEWLQNCQRNVVVKIFGVLYNELYKFELYGEMK